MRLSVAKAGAVLIVLSVVVALLWMGPEAAIGLSADLDACTLTADREIVAADGVAAAKITVVVRDHAGRPIAAAPVLVTSSSDDRSEHFSSVTDADGRMTATVRSTSPGRRIVVASIDSRELPHRLAILFAPCSGPRLEILERSVAPRGAVWSTIHGR